MFGTLAAGAAFLFLNASDTGASGPASNVLRQARLTQSRGASNAVRIADGTAPSEGDFWDTRHTAVLEPDGALEWDLGSVTAVAAIRLQADNNDTYRVSASDDGTSFSTLWLAGPVEPEGLQTRTSPPLAAHARYLRLTAEGGDARYSIGELEVFETVEGLVGAALTRIAPSPPPRAAPPPPFDSGLLLVVGVGLLGGFLLHRARQKNLRALESTTSKGKKET